MNLDDTVIDVVTVASDELLQGMRQLLPKLSSSAPALTSEQLEEIVCSDCTALFIARNSRADIIGSVTLAMFRAPTGLRAWIEDVVVDESARGQGVGERLTRAAIEHSTAAGARSVDLTSRPSRTAAHRLYEKVGFRVRDTQVYRYTSGQPHDSEPSAEPPHR